LEKGFKWISIIDTNGMFWCLNVFSKASDCTLQSILEGNISHYKNAPVSLSFKNWKVKNIVFLIYDGLIICNKGLNLNECVNSAFRTFPFGSHFFQGCGQQWTKSYSKLLKQDVCTAPYICYACSNLIYCTQIPYIPISKRLLQWYMFHRPQCIMIVKFMTAFL